MGESCIGEFVWVDLLTMIPLVERKDNWIHLSEVI